MPDAQGRLYRFGPFVLDLQTRELRDGGAPVVLTAKAFDVLRLLVENRHRVVGRDELLGTVWAGRVVEENNLAQAIAALRRAFGTSGGDHRYIVTVPGRGYRFVADVATPGTWEDSAERTEGRRLPPVRRPAPRHVLAAAAVIGVVGLGTLAGLSRHRGDATAEAPRQGALAVLPFRTIGPAPRDELLGQGLSETLIARISHASALRVRSSSSSRQVDPAQDPLEAGRSLGAAYVVEGSIQRDGGRVRVGARLLSVGDGRTLWSGTFDEEAGRVFTLQDRIATAMTTALAVRLDAAPWQSPCTGADPEAYRAYLAGTYQGERPSGVRTRQALASFQRAIERDPACAIAWAGMAQAYRRAVMTGDEDPRRNFPLAQAAVTRALRIAPELPEAHAAQGFIRFWYDWDWQGAEDSLRHALAINPSLPEAELAYAHLLSSLARHDEAIEHVHRMVALDPLSPLANTLAARFLGVAGREAEAQDALAKALELEPNFWVALLTRGSWRMGHDPAGAIDDLQRARRACGDCSQALSVLGQALVAAGRREEARQLLVLMQARDRAGYFPATGLAAVHNALGETGPALDLIERGYAERDVGMSFLQVDRRWDNLRDEPRFRALMARMGLGEDPLAAHPPRLRGCVVVPVAKENGDTAASAAQACGDD
jgi:DNA-binding winged helix-turn-helix (wHTH) protein/TolB-like protein/Tfp pilus assembly protein PilF